MQALLGEYLSYPHSLELSKWQLRTDDPAVSTVNFIFALVTTSVCFFRNSWSFHSGWPAPSGWILTACGHFCICLVRPTFLRLVRSYCIHIDASIIIGLSCSFFWASCAIIRTRMFIAVEEVRQQSMGGIRTRSAVMVGARSESSCYELQWTLSIRQLCRNRNNR